MHLLRRWATFNVVGAMGVAVQLGVLAGLVRWGGLNYLIATTLAVEAAIIHNFFWHQRWTWRDRPATTPRGIAIRFANFHLANGVISIFGNIALMTALTGILRFDPIVANVVAIASCSLVNFAAGTAFVFRRRTIEVGQPSRA